MRYEFDFTSVLAHWPLLLEGILVTLRLTFFATVAGIALGTLSAIAKTDGPPWLRRCVAVYVEVIRNTPLLIQAYFLIFGMASLGLRMPIIVGASLALVINIGAYTTEIVRAGIEAIHHGQIEAAECLGMNKLQIYLHVVVRPALERVYPALASQYVLMMLASSILSSVGVEELFGIASRIQSETFRNFEVFVVIGVAYLLLAMLVRGAFRALGAVLFPRRRKLGTPL